MLLLLNWVPLHVLLLILNWVPLDVLLLIIILGLFAYAAADNYIGDHFHTLRQFVELY